MYRTTCCDSMTEHVQLCIALLAVTVWPDMSSYVSHYLLWQYDRTCPVIYCTTCCDSMTGHVQLCIALLAVTVWPEMSSYVSHYLLWQYDRTFPVIHSTTFSPVMHSTFSVTVWADMYSYAYILPKLSCQKAPNSKVTIDFNEFSWCAPLIAM